MRSAVRIAKWITVLVFLAGGGVLTTVLIAAALVHAEPTMSVPCTPTEGGVAR